ncbi:MAG: insulinase family protein [Desulfuromonadales bacterium]|nr:insulinase family protein [Desulfuromonadales bacterium]
MNAACGEYFRDILPNGLRLITVEMPHLHSAEMMCYVGVGGRHETPEFAGISHFLEHMLFRGTAEHPSSLELEQAFEAIGGAVNASTDPETTCYHSRLHPQELATGASLFASMLRRPLLRELETERRIILEEALEDLNEKGEEISPDNLIARLLWPGHALSLPTIGTRESISRIGEAELRQHHQSYYTPLATVVAVAGPVRRAEVVTAVTAAFGDWQGGGPPACLPAPAAVESAPEAVWKRDSDSQVSLQFAFRLPGRAAVGSISLRLLRRLLSGGGASRLMLQLREKLGLTYSVEANLALLADTGVFSVDLAVARENLVPAVREVLAIFSELHRHPAGEAELARVVRNFLFDLDFSRDHTDEMAGRYGWGEAVGFLRTVDQDRQEALAVTPQELWHTARQLFVPAQLKLAATGPFGARERRQVEKLLATWQPAASLTEPHR